MPCEVSTGTRNVQGRMAGFFGCHQPGESARATGSAICRSGGSDKDSRHSKEEPACLGMVARFAREGKEWTCPGRAPPTRRARWRNRLRQKGAGGPQTAMIYCDHQIEKAIRDRAQTSTPNCTFKI